MENSMAGPKIKSRITIGSRNSISLYYPKELTLGTLAGICKSKFILALQPRGGAASQCSQKDEWIDKMQGIHMTENHSTLKQKETPDPCQCRWSPEDTMLRSQPGTKEHIPYDSTYLRSLKQSHSLRQKVGWWLPETHRRKHEVSI